MIGCQITEHEPGGAVRGTPLLAPRLAAGAAARIILAASLMLWLLAAGVAAAC